MKFIRVRGAERSEVTGDTTDSTVAAKYSVSLIPTSIDIDNTHDSLPLLALCRVPRSSSSIVHYTDTDYGRHCLQSEAASPLAPGRRSYLLPKPSTRHRFHQLRRGLVPICPKRRTTHRISSDSTTDTLDVCDTSPRSAAHLRCSTVLFKLAMILID